MTLKDLIMQTSFDEISPEARKVYHVHACPYASSTDNALRNIFDRLKGIVPVTIEMIIDIVDYDVMGCKKSPNGSAKFYSLTACPWENWLSMRISDESLKELSPEEIVANCLYEMSWWGYDEKTIQTKVEDVFTRFGKGDSNISDVEIYKLENGVAIINEGITEIPESCFEDMSELKEVFIPNTVTCIGEYAFRDCTSLQSIVIPDSVTIIGKGAFGRCTGLQSVVISNSVEDIDKNAFCGCNQLASIILPNTMKVMREALFSGCSKLTTVIIPESVLVIENGVFSDCENLTHIKIPRNVKEIVPGQFYGCSKLSTITVDKRNSVYDCREDCNGIIETATNSLVAGCTTTVIPNTVTSIGPRAFCERSHNRSFFIPRSVVSIEPCAFSYCPGLTSIEIPDTVRNIECDAFADCKELTTVIFKGAETKIRNLFEDCECLQSIFVPAGSEERYKSMLPEKLHDKIKTSIFSN